MAFVRSIPPEAQLPSQWDPLWPSLVEHFHLLCSGGRTGEEVAALLTPALAPERSDTAEASWQLLSLLRRHGNLAAPKASSDSEHTADSSDEANVSKETTGVALNESAAYRSLVLTMGARNSDEDDDGGSSSVGLVGDDGLPIAEINDNTEGAVVTVADVTHQLPLHQRCALSHHLNVNSVVTSLSPAPKGLRSLAPRQAVKMVTRHRRAPCLLFIFLQPLRRGEQKMLSKGLATLSSWSLQTSTAETQCHKEAGLVRSFGEAYISLIPPPPPLSGFWSDSDPEDLELPSLKKDDNSDF